jgi:uncharacterized damage-inducible protein DinB
MQCETEYIHQIGKRFRDSFDHVVRAAGQLSDDQLWLRPSSHSNSAGIILQHLIGNLSQWVLAGIGDAAYVRDRPKEFRDDSHPSREEILGSFSDVGEKIQKVLAALPPDTLLDRRTIQTFDTTVMAALLMAITHCEFHEGQILFIAKYILNEKYEGVWGPPKK